LPERGGEGKKGEKDIGKGQSMVRNWEAAEYLWGSRTKWNVEKCPTNVSGVEEKSGGNGRISSKKEKKARQGLANIAKKARPVEQGERETGDQNLDTKEDGKILTHSDGVTTNIPSIL